MNARLCLVEINLLRHGRSRRPRRRQCRLLRRLHLGTRSAGHGRLRIGLARGALRATCHPLRPLKFERGARSHRAGQQITVFQAAGIGTLEIGEERAARIGGNGGDRSGARAEAEPMQGQRSFRFGIEGHASMSLSTATPRQP